MAILALGTYSALAEVPSAEGHVHITTCLFKLSTGISCPGCGMGRGLKFFFHLDFYNSLMINPMSTLLGIAMVVGFFWLIYDMVKKSATLHEFVFKKRPVWIYVILVVLVVANWVWNIKKGV